MRLCQERQGRRLEIESSMRHTSTPGRLHPTGVALPVGVGSVARHEACTSKERSDWEILHCCKTIRK